MRLTKILLDATGTAIRTTAGMLQQQIKSRCGLRLINSAPVQDRAAPIQLMVCLVVCNIASGQPSSVCFFSANSMKRSSADR